MGFCVAAMGFWGIASLVGALIFVIIYFAKTMGRKGPKSTG